MADEPNPEATPTPTADEQLFDEMMAALDAPPPEVAAEPVPDVATAPPVKPSPPLKKRKLRNNEEIDEPQPAGVFATGGGSNADPNAEPNAGSEIPGLDNANLPGHIRAEIEAGREALRARKNR